MVPDGFFRKISRMPLGEDELAENSSVVARMLLVWKAGYWHDVRCIVYEIGRVTLSIANFCRYDG